MIPVIETKRLGSVDVSEDVSEADFEKEKARLAILSLKADKALWMARCEKLSRENEDLRRLCASYSEKLEKVQAHCELLERQLSVLKKKVVYHNPIPIKEHPPC